MAVQMSETGSLRTIHTSILGVPQTVWFKKIVGDKYEYTAVLWKLTRLQSVYCQLARQE